MGMGHFRDQILRASVSGHGGVTVLNALIETILSLIDLERKGEMIDCALIKSCTYMLDALYEREAQDETTRLYLTAFEPAYLSASREFYIAESQRLLQNVDASSFCRQADARLQEERDRCQLMLYGSNIDKIESVVDKELIGRSIEGVVNHEGSGAHFMIDNDRHDDLLRLFQLNGRVDRRRKHLRAAIQRKVIATGAEINNVAKESAKAPVPKPAAEASAKTDGEGKAGQERALNQQTLSAVKWVDDVLRLKDKYDLILKKSLNGDQELQAAISKSFTEFINTFDRASENLSLFFDENLKKGIKNKTESEVDRLLDNGIMLLRYIQDKDMFERYYKKHLSRRLLMKRSVSMDAERQMISKMKVEVGSTFTQRIESMFKDMALSDDLSRSYKDEIKKFGSADRARAELEVNMLTSTMWPLEDMGSANLAEEGAGPVIYPSSIDRVKQGFEKYYLDKHTGRKVTWLGSLGSADIRAYFPKSKSNMKFRELNVSTYAMLVLLLFNDLSPDTSLTTEEIQAATNIPLHDLTRNLQSLAVAPKTRVLIKEPMSKDIKLTDRFSFNESFHHPSTKVKIGVVSANRVEGADERKQTEKKTNDTRTYVIEATIVRIMK